MNTHFTHPIGTGTGIHVTPQPHYPDEPHRQSAESAESINWLNSYPPELSKFGEWKSISYLEVSYEKWFCDHSHLYFNDLLLKAHNPASLFEKLRTGLSENQYLAFQVSTAENIKQGLQSKYPPLLYNLYYVFHFVGRRVLPKLKGFRKISRLLRIPVDMSKAEIMGRLIYHGFDIVDICENLEHTLFVTRRQQAVAPCTYAPPSKEGFVFSMMRLGKDNKPITVYKFRSMHPYAEYAQAYLHRTNGLDPGGKFKDDYRVSTGGKLIRKYWIDELPMLYNLIRGDLKLVGVRPISSHYFTLYPEKLQTLRGKYKPGLLPPFYADMPEGFDEIVQSEVAYLESYEKAPLRTDLYYLGKIIKNIIYHKARSK